MYVCIYCLSMCLDIFNAKHNSKYRAMSLVARYCVRHQIASASELKPMRNLGQCCYITIILKSCQLAMLQMRCTDHTKLTLPALRIAPHSCSYSENIMPSVFNYFMLTVIGIFNFLNRNHNVLSSSFVIAASFHNTIFPSSLT